MELGIILNFILSLWIIPYYLGSKRKIGYNESYWLLPVTDTLKTSDSKNNKI